MAVRILIADIPHRRHRYATVGDWFWRRNRLHIFVSKMMNPDYIFLVAVHELIEAWLCFRRGIREQDVTRFDMAFEQKRKQEDVSEPGDDKQAPYRREHRFATRIEKLVAKELGVDWDAYEKVVDSL